MSGGDSGSIDKDSKRKWLEHHTSDPTGKQMTTDQGIGVHHTDDSLKAGLRGPTLLEDFHFREKLTRFDHERIPERAVHARGYGVHGYFEAYGGCEDITTAEFLTKAGQQTPVFVRFSTVVGSRGSADTARDVRGFAVKFYTGQGNFDLVGNNMPVFFIIDGIKFPDLVHSVKPEPHNEIPQAQAAHDTFWDFIGLTPESMHMIMWVLSDRAIPRSYRMMEGFGVHSFRMVNARGEGCFVKFHWKPVLGAASLIWEESLLLGGADPDFHRRDLFEAIEAGHYPQWELGVQVIPDSQAESLGIELLDPTKIVPEELVPVRKLGRMTLNRNPDNFFAETEQVAFCPANLVPGIGLSNDPLLQARLFSYLDTQITRLNGPNFHELPINRALAPVHNHQVDGANKYVVPRSRATYHPNSLGNGSPTLHSRDSAYVHYPERVAGEKTRARADSFYDHYTQAALFFRSMSDVEQQHIIDAGIFELSKCERVEVRRRVVDHFGRIDEKLAKGVAEGLGLPAPDTSQQVGPVELSPKLSLENLKGTSIATRKVAILLADGFDSADLDAVRDALEAEGAMPLVVAPTLAAVMGTSGQSVTPDKAFFNSKALEFDATCVVGGPTAAAVLQKKGAAKAWLAMTYKHYKPLAAMGASAQALLPAVGIQAGAAGVVTASGAQGARELVEAIRAHRHWDRSDADQIGG